MPVYLGLVTLQLDAVNPDVSDKSVSWESEWLGEVSGEGTELEEAVCHPDQEFWLALQPSSYRFKY